MSDSRDQAATENIFEQAQATTSIVPVQITTDKEPAHYSSISIAFPSKTKHRDSKHMKNKIEKIIVA